MHISPIVSGFSESKYLKKKAKILSRNELLISLFSIKNVNKKRKTSCL